MKRFKIPLIATAVIIVLMFTVGLTSISLIYNSEGSNREKAQRASMAGGSVATIGCIALAPFWLYTAMQIGKERRRLKR